MTNNWKGMLSLVQASRGGSINDDTISVGRARRKSTRFYVRQFYVRWPEGRYESTMTISAARRTQ